MQDTLRLTGITRYCALLRTGHPSGWPLYSDRGVSWELSGEGAALVAGATTDFHTNEAGIEVGNEADASWITLAITS